MTLEAIVLSCAAGLFAIVCGLIVFIFTSLNKSVEAVKTDLKNEVVAFREMLDAKLTQLGHALEIINKDLREIISATDKELRGELTVLDRRTTRLEASAHGRRDEDKP